MAKNSKWTSYQGSEPQPHPSHRQESYRTAAKHSPFDSDSAVDVKFVGCNSDVNASAEAFIKRFRKQLEMQRLGSLESHKMKMEKGF